MINSYKIYLSGVPGLDDDWQLPINPENEFFINIQNKFDTTDVFGLGEVILKRNQSLKSFGWSSYLPIDSQDALVYNGIDNFDANPIEQAEALRNAQNSKIELYIVIEDNGFGKQDYISESVILKSFRTTDRGGNPGDIFYTIEFTEFREPEIKKIVLPPPPTPPVTGTGTVSGFSGTQFIPDTGKDNKVPVVGNELAIGDKVGYNGYAFDKDCIYGDVIEGSNSKYLLFKQNTNIGNASGNKNVKQTITSGKEGTTKESTTLVSYRIFQQATGRIEEVCDGQYDSYKGKFYKIKLDNPVESQSLFDKAGAALLTAGSLLTQFFTRTKYNADGTKNTSEIKSNIEVKKIDSIWCKGNACYLVSKYNGLTDFNRSEANKRRQTNQSSSNNGGQK